MNREVGLINALFLVRAYTQSYLLDWLVIQGASESNRSQETESKTDKKLCKRIICGYYSGFGFARILTTHFILNNINLEMYKKLRELNKIRNEIAHELPFIDIQNQRNKEKIKGAIDSWIDCCKEISKSYKNALDKRAEAISSIRPIKKEGRFNEIQWNET